MKFKTKLELDLMERIDIIVYHDKLMSSKSSNDSKVARYDSELLFYLDVRFKEHTLAQISEWLQKRIDAGSKISNNTKPMYLTGLLQCLPEDNIFLYITPMDFPIDMPLDYLIKMKVHFDVFNK